MGTTNVGIGLGSGVSIGASIVAFGVSPVGVGTPVGVGVDVCVGFTTGPVVTVSSKVHTAIAISATQMAAIPISTHVKVDRPASLIANSAPAPAEEGQLSLSLLRPPQPRTATATGIESCDSCLYR